MRRRRKAKYTWMPTLGGVINDGAGSAYGYTNVGATFAAQVKNTDSVPVVTPLVPDETRFPDETGTEASTLRDFTEGQDWLCKRIVGKIFINAQREAGTITPGTAWPFFTVGAAFFVARSKDGQEDQPDLDPTEYDPLGSQNVRQPWMWRRLWIIDSGAPVFGSNTTTSNRLSTSNFAFANSALDGPHIDAKVARRIRREERLWFVLNAQGFNVSPTAYDTLSVATADEGKSFLWWTLDYRILGAMRKSNNRSTF